MSNFKVLPAGQLAPHQQRETILPKIPNIVLPSQITLLNYPVEALTEQIHAFFEEKPIDKASLLRVLKVVGCSLNDNKLISSIEKIISSQMGIRNGQIYALIALWAGQRLHLSDFLLRLTNNLRRGLLFLIFEQYFMGSHSREFGIQQQLGALLSLSSHNELLQELLKRYQLNKNPLKIVVRKCMRIQSEHQALKLMTSAFVGACITGKTQRLMEFDLEEQTSELEYLLQVVPSSGPALISQLKQSITEQTLSKMNSPRSSKVNAVLQSAAKEWLNQKNNYWKVVERGFTAAFNFQTKVSLQYGRMVLKEGAASECLAVQLLYSYFQGQRFDFEAGDALVTDRQRQNWIQVYRAISQCSSHRLANLVVVNKSFSPSWWKVYDPKKTTSKAVKKLIQKHSDFLEQKQKELSLGNKKMELAFSVIIAIDKQTSQQYAVTIQQLQKWLNDGESPRKNAFREEYPPFRPQIKAKQQAKKEHNIIIQAKLVRILKRAKQSLSPEALAKESGYNLETVELGAKRLVSKSLAQEDGKGGYQYLA